MKKTLTASILSTLFLLVFAPSVWAQNLIQQLSYDAPDGNRITGFIYHPVNAPEDAPVAVLMHGLTGSSLHWLAGDNFTRGDKITAMLIEKGYRIVALDARSHGVRADDQDPMARVMAARAGEPGSYEIMIKNTIADYRFLLDQITERFENTDRIVVIGYSMGGQMGTLLAASDPRVTHLVTMVPPAVRNVPSVAPITHAPKVTVPWLLLTATKDQFSTPEQNAELILAGGEYVTNISFESGHVLPTEYLTTIGPWLENK